MLGVMLGDAKQCAKTHPASEALTKQLLLWHLMAHGLVQSLCDGAADGQTGAQGPPAGQGRTQSLEKEQSSGGVQ